MTAQAHHQKCMEDLLAGGACLTVLLLQIRGAAAARRSTPPAAVRAGFQSMRSAVSMALQTDGSGVTGLQKALATCHGVACKVGWGLGLNF